MDSDRAPRGFTGRQRIAKTRYDCRHYVRLFRRLIESDVLKTFENICNEYYALHALPLKPRESFAPATSFIYNLFDNDNPEIAGNALVRYRVLEYFLSNHEVGELFDSYFTGLGPGPRVSREVLSAFAGAGLIAPMEARSEGTMTVTGYTTTSSGRRLLELARSLWYGICVKTGMHVYDFMIKRGQAARVAAEKTIGTAYPALVDFYATHGWVSDDDFIEFLYAQEALEARRVGNYQLNHPEKAMQIAGLLESRSSIADILNAEYDVQLYYWKQK